MKHESVAMGRAAVTEVSTRASDQISYYEIPGNRQFSHRHAHTHAETTRCAPTSDAEIVDAAGTTTTGANSSLFAQIVIIITAADASAICAQLETGGLGIRQGTVLAYP